MSEQATTPIERYSQADLEKINAFLRDKTYPDELKSWVKDWVAGHILSMPADQLLGIPTYLFRIATSVPNADSISSGSWGDVATVGPTLNNLAKGTWFVIWGCNMVAAASSVAHMGISINGGGPSDSNAAKSRSNTPNVDRGETSYFRDFGTPSGGPGLTLEQNTIQAKYRLVSGAAMTVSNRWLAALRIGDLAA